jgi:hypothetical protein
MPLSEEKYDGIDQFIATHPPKIKMPPLKERNYEYGKIIYRDIQSAPGRMYCIFASEGYDTFALYKSGDGVIYVIMVSLQSLYGYCAIDETWF